MKINRIALFHLSLFLFAFSAFSAVDGKKFEAIPTGVVSLKSFVTAPPEPAKRDPFFIIDKNYAMRPLVRCACSRTDFDRVLEALK